MEILDNNLNFSYNPGNRSITKYIILHHAATIRATVEQIHSWHLGRGWAGIGYHFYVRKDGSVYKGREIGWTGGHTTNYNYCSIGVCFEGNFENESMNDVQKQAGAELITYIQELYDYSLEVRKHKDFNATACPGSNFPFDYISNGYVTEPEETNPEESNEPSDWAVNYCNDMIERKIFIGDENNNYHWHDNVTREELAVVLSRVFSLLGE